MKTLQGRYRVLQELGRGGEGTTYLCDDLRLPGRHWTVKEMPLGSGEREAFEREAVLLSRLDHPRIPVVGDFFVQDGQGYLVREFLDGPSLHQWIERGGPVEQPLAVQWGIQIGEVLSYLHHQEPPIFHRDLKPQNLILLGDGLKLIDFGLARSGRGAIESRAGSLSFTAPEQIGAEHPLLPTADIYSLGAILYYLLKGVPPGPTGGQHRILPHRRDLLPDLEQVILQCLEEAPERRPVEVDLVLNSLQMLAQRLPPPSPPSITPRPGLLASLPKAPPPVEAVPSPVRSLLLASVPLMAVLTLAGWLVFGRGQPVVAPDLPLATSTPSAADVVPWIKVQDYMSKGRWAEAEGALRGALATDPGSGWARLLLVQLPRLRRGESLQRVPLLLPLGGQEGEHVNWILQGVALGQMDEPRFLFDLIDTHEISVLKAWQRVGDKASVRPGLVVGPFGSQEALLLAPLAAGSGIPVIPLGSTDRRVRSAAANLFPVGFPHWDRITALLAHALMGCGPKGIVLYSADSKAMTSSAQFAAERLAKMAPARVPLLAYTADQSVDELARQIAAGRPDWIYLSENQLLKAAAWIRALRNAGITSPIICVFHPAARSFCQELKDVSGQTWLVEPLWQESQPDFVRRWEEVYGHGSVDWNSALGYDAARLASLHWRPGGPKEVLGHLTEAGSHQGLLGVYDLGHKKFEPAPFPYRQVVVEGGVPRPGEVLPLK